MTESELDAALSTAVGVVAAFREQGNGTLSRAALADYLWTAVVEVGGPANLVEALAALVLAVSSLLAEQNGVSLGVVLNAVGIAMAERSAS